MEADKYKYYLGDLARLLLEEIKKTHADLSSKHGSELDYSSGEIMALYSTLDLMKSQAKAFDIPLNELGLDGIRLEDFLVV